MRHAVLPLVLFGVLYAPSAAAQAPPDDADVEVGSTPAPAPTAPAAPAPPASANPPVPAAQAVAHAAAPASPSTQEIEALRTELREAQARLEAQLRKLEAAPAPAQAPSYRSTIAPSDFLISAYIQAQYESHQDSENGVLQGGGLLNQDRFLIRRGRVRLDAAWQWAELSLELDGNTTRAPTLGLRRAEASLVWRGTRDPRGWSGKIQPRGPRDGVPPPLMVSLGLTDIPFGFELVDSARDRVFMERSAGSLAFFPGEPDLGLRVSGGLGPFRYALAVMNGEPLDDRSPTAGRDPNIAKDLVGRLGFDARPNESFRVAGGTSVLRGTGFHPGTSATKNVAQWNDTNENAAIDQGEVTASPGAAASPSWNFTRWAFGFDLELRLRTRLGWSMLYGEATIANNLDRGLFVADPVTTGISSRELSFYGAFVQEITKYGLVGFRADYYDPNADFFDKRVGKLLPSSLAIKTYSPLVGVALPDVARLVFQYDIIGDYFSRDTTGVPKDLKNDRWTLRLQVQL